jgi:hypothetical protein
MEPLRSPKHPANPTRPPDVSTAWGLRRLSLLAAATASLYIFGLALRYPLLEGIVLPRHGWARLAGGAPLAAMLLHIAVYTAATALYLTALRLLLRRPPHSTAPPHNPAAHRRLIGLIVGGWLLFSAILLAVAPGGEAHDIFDYLYRGRMLVEYGGNPLADTPTQFADHPFYAYITWTDHVDTYGPIWEYTSGAVASGTRMLLQATGLWGPGPVNCGAAGTTTSGGTSGGAAGSCLILLSYVQAYRLLAVALAGLCGWLIYRLSSEVARALAPAALLAWLWNPLLLVSSAVGAHNDLLMLAFVLGSFWALQRRRRLGALLLLVLAAHVKLTALALAPVYGLWLVRKLGWGRALALSAAAVAVGLVFSWLLYAPLGGWGTLPRMLDERQRYVALSFHHIAYRLLSAEGLDGSLLWLLTIRGPTLLYAVAAVLASLWMLGARRAVPEGAPDAEAQLLWRTAAVVNLLYLLIGSFWFQPWYVLWVLAPAALLPSSGLLQAVVAWLCAGALYSNVLAGYLPHLPGQPLGRTARVTAAVLSTWLPPALGGLFAWRARTRRRAPAQRNY